jgi:acetoin utilization deacetylase AcuC-like enzyme
MKLFFPDTPELPLPPEHRFPRGKYRLLRDKLEGEGIVDARWLSPSPEAGLAVIARAHSRDYIDEVMSGRLSREAQRLIGLPWSEVLALRARVVVGGALAAALGVAAARLPGAAGVIPCCTLACAPATVTPGLSTKRI